MASGNLMMRRNLRELGLPSCHRAGGLRNRQNGLPSMPARNYREINALRPDFDALFQAIRSRTFVSACESDFQRIRVLRGRPVSNESGS
jgi:hypothetical protein